jgi:vacuolar-type H+-ATPase subunit E/Vma4
MSLEKILERILAGAQTEADRFIKESHRKADEIRKKAHQQGKEQAEALLEEVERQGRLEASRLVTQARLDKRIKILACKKELIDEVLDRAFQKERIEEKGLKQKIIMKDGEKEVSFDQEKLKQDLRPRLENEIAEVLKI